MSALIQRGLFVFNALRHDFINHEFINHEFITHYHNQKSSKMV